MTLSELRRIAAQRTKGEWIWRDDELCSPSQCKAPDWSGLVLRLSGGASVRVEDTEFIAAMANHIDRLLDVVEAAESLKNRLFPVYLEMQNKCPNELPKEWEILYERLAALEGE